MNRVSLLGFAALSPPDFLCAHGFCLSTLFCVCCLLRDVRKSQLHKQSTNGQKRWQRSKGCVSKPGEASGSCASLRGTISLTDCVSNHYILPANEIPSVLACCMASPPEHGFEFSKVSFERVRHQRFVSRLSDFLDVATGVYGWVL